MNTDVRERMDRYIAETQISDRLHTMYDMRLDELLAVSKLLSQKPFEAIMVAFEFGLAKGFRAAKAEARRG